MFPCIPSESVVPQRRSPASHRVLAGAILLAVLMLLVAPAAQAAPGAARRPAAPFDLLDALRSWLVAQIVMPADGEKTPDSAPEVGAQPTLGNTSANSDSGILIDPDGTAHH